MIKVHTSLILDLQVLKWEKETAKDTARVLGGMYDGIEYRGFSQRTVETLAQYSGVPVWNGLTDEDHPTQVLADFLTAKEVLKKSMLISTLLMLAMDVTMLLTH